MPNTNKSDISKVSKTILVTIGWPIIWLFIGGVTLVVIDILSEISVRFRHWDATQPMWITLLVTAVIGYIVRELYKALPFPENS